MSGKVQQKKSTNSKGNSKGIGVDSDGFVNYLSNDVFDNNKETFDDGYDSKEDEECYGEMAQVEYIHGSMNEGIDDGALASEEAGSHYQDSESEEEVNWTDDECDTEFLKLPSKYRQLTTMYDARKRSPPSDEEINSFPKKFKYDDKIGLSVTQVALVDLANILSTRHKVDKKLFKDLSTKIFGMKRECFAVKKS